MTVVTFCASIRDPRADDKLSPMGALFAQARHDLFVALHVHHEPIARIKRRFIKEYGLTGRQFNGIRFDIDQVVASERGSSKFLLEQRHETIASLSERIDRETAKLEILISAEKIRAVANLKFKITGRKQRLDRLKGGLPALEARAARSIPAICFGGREGLREAQATGEMWRWRQRREGRVFLVGAKCETHGNQSVSLTDGTLRIRQPNWLGGGHIELEGVDFRQPEAREMLHRLKDAETRTAATWLIFRDEAGDWQVRLTVERPRVRRVGRIDAGVVAIDLNVDHLAVVVVDRYGNACERMRLPFPTAGVSEDAATNAIGCMVGSIVSLAASKGMAVAIESLNFSKKKAGLREYGTAHARRLSNFGYAKFREIMRSRCDRSGVDLHEVDPAYTSVIGRAKYAGRRGLTVHMAAALVIGRRALGYGERLVRSDGVPLDAPARMRPRIEGRRWRGVRKAPQEGAQAPVRTAGQVGSIKARAGLRPQPGSRLGLDPGRRPEVGTGKSGVSLPGRSTDCYG